MGKALVGTRSRTGEGIATTKQTGGALTPGQENAIRDAMDASRAPATRRIYNSAWGRFAAWCEAAGHPTLPAPPEAVAAYLAERAQSGLAPASIRLDRAAIRAIHLAKQLPTPTEHPGVATVTRGLGRIAAAGRTTRQAAALTGEALAAVRATALTPRRGSSGRLESTTAARKRGNVDIALASTMRDGLLRRSEAAALTWGDVDLRTDGTGRILIPRSKTDQEGEGAVQYLGKDAAAALRLIRPAPVEDAARVFGFKSGRTIARRLARMATAAGLSGAFSGHSGRVGMARDLVASGASVAAVQVAGRWISERMPALYARGELAARGAVAKYYGG